MNVQQENEAAADVLRDANASAPAGSLGVWEHYFVAKHRDATPTIWTFGLRVGGIFVAIVGPGRLEAWSWHVSYGGPRGHAETPIGALAAAREAAQPEARKWVRGSAAA